MWPWATPTSAPPFAASGISPANTDVTTAVKRSGGAVALCSFTTTVGYGSLLVADNQALQSFGRLAMSGEITCIIGAMIVLPSLLHLWRVKGHRTPTSSAARPESPPNTTDSTARSAE